MEILAQLWSLLGLLTVLQNILPSQLLSLLHSFYESLHDFFSPYSYFDIPEFNGYCGVDVNDLYRHANLYLNSLNPSATCSHLTLSRSKSSNRIAFTVAPNHTVHDSFNGHRLSWTHHVETVQDSLDEKRSFTLRLPKRHRLALLSPYLDHVATRAEEFERVSRERRLFTNTGHGSYESGWASVPFHHPSTFETLALEPDLKRQLTEDLTAISNGREFYHKIGRAWKRGYLLYGPPGSGKSSLIAAMANFLCYDVYDLELSKVSDNSELRALLIQTTNRSIIVIEDIDCSVDLTADRLSKTSRKVTHREKQGRRVVAADSGEENGRVTLSGLLNFTDGLWSCCGSERIFVFTTNHIEKLDPALLRSGRMDMHILMSYCSFPALKILLKNYLGFEEGDLDGEVLKELEEIIDQARMTPADISEVLIKNRRCKDKAVTELLEILKAKAERNGRRPRDHGNSGDVEEEEEEEEEQEKRALESPKQGSDQLQESCEKCGEEEDDDDDNKKPNI